MLLLWATALLASPIAAQDPYAPSVGACPTSGSLLRSGGQSPLEADYVTRHKQAVSSLWQQFFSANNHNTGYDLGRLFPNNTAVPTLGIACSGGGYRAALACAGSMTAFDLRNTSTPVGGVLQMASYISGLSGGSWAVGSWAINNFPDWTSLVLGNTSANLNGWQLQYNLVIPDGLNVIRDGEFLDHISDQVDAKERAGFGTSITDWWGRALSYHFAPGTTGDNFYDYDATSNNHASNITWSSLTQGSQWTSAAAPVPLLVADSLPENMTVGAVPLTQAYVPITSTVYEFSPFEFGSHDAALATFINVTYTGTQLTNGNPANSSACVTGFENFGFTIGTSASLFNAIVSTVNSTVATGDSELLQRFINDIGEDIRNGEDDVAIYPNSFTGQAPSTFNRSNNQTLELVDGGENGENVPLRPMLVPSRGLDIIIASDNSADTNDFWPNATSLFATQEAGQALNWNVTLPPLPANQEAIVASGFNKRPIFFGCNASTESNVSWPLVVYLPNAPTSASSYQTNTSTYKLEYDVSDASAFLDSSHDNAAQIGTNLSSTWPVCLSCALVERARARAGLPLSSTCSDCFNNYCYGGSNVQTVNSTTAPGSQASTRSLGSKQMQASVAGAIAAAIGVYIAA